MIPNAVFLHPHARPLTLFTLLLMAAVPVGANGVAPSSGAVHNPSASAAWKHGPPVTPGYFPLAVWLQAPENARRYADAGINLYIGLWEGPTDAQLAALKAAKMPVICEQTSVGLSHRDDPIIVGWMHNDEPDNAQPMKNPTTGEETYGPPVPPARIVSDYQRIRRADPTRPVMLNLGQGVANDEWNGRGSDAKPDDYLTYVKGANLVSFDVYPVAGLDKPHPENYLWYVPKGVERLRRWTGGRKAVWTCLETGPIGDGARSPSPRQVRAEAWMALIHGASGIIYFVHQFAPAFNEHALLDNPEMLKAVTALNREILSLASALNSPTVPDGATVTVTKTEVPVAHVVKRNGKTTWLFAAGMRNGATTATFTLKDGKATTAEVIGEGRRIPVTKGRFTDTFAPYDVHLYRFRR